LVKVGDCISCHTDSAYGGQPFAGGLEFDTPFGKLYTTNITPDKETGIGLWAEEDFIRAMQHGILPDGSYMFPVFPFTSFTKVSENDLRAIWAYLQSIPPVKQRDRKPELLFPLNWRYLQLGWRTMFFDSGEYEYNQDESPEWNRGAYLVEGLGHCTECHTPRNIFGAVKKKYHLTGAFIEGYWAPDITQYGLRTASIYDIADVFAGNELLHRTGPVAGPMAEVNHNSLSQLTEEDRLAIATYLKTVDSKQPYHQRPAEYKSEYKHGRQVYLNVCIACHQRGEMAAPVIGNTSSWEYRAQEGLVTLYRHTINGYNQMPIKGACVTCEDDDIIAAVDYIVSRSVSRTTWQNLLEDRASPIPKHREIDGKAIYQENCATCHDNGKLGAPKIGDKAVWAPLLDKNMDVLILNTMNGIGNMPAKGGCQYCTTAEVVAAVKYIVQESKTEGDYSLW
jgi:cytochrome c5